MPRSRGCCWLKKTDTSDDRGGPPLISEENWNRRKYRSESVLLSHVKSLVREEVLDAPGVVALELDPIVFHRATTGELAL